MLPAAHVDSVPKTASLERLPSSPFGWKIGKTWKPFGLQRNLEVISGLSKDVLTYLHAGVEKRKRGAATGFRVFKVRKTKPKIVPTTTIWF